MVLGAPAQRPVALAAVPGVGRGAALLMRRHKAGRDHSRTGLLRGSDIPNYWAYAENFVLNDRMYESAHC